MENAIKNGFLCKYKYEPFFVTFTDDEWEEYLDLTRKIHIKGENETINTKAALKRQLLKDQAVNKSEAVFQIVGTLIENESYKNTLIYCPKGINDEEERYIHILQDNLKEKFPILNTATFLGETKNRDMLLKDFEEDLVDMLLAIKCLDEGVNIPKTMNAIFVASGQNYREYIQRRGRVLRNYRKGIFKKEFANLYDVVILPSREQFRKDKQTAENLITSEFMRLYEFYNLASENFNAFKKINDELEKYGLTEGYIRSKINKN
jgi:superfamily II DNA or RNA helicase